MELFSREARALVGGHGSAFANLRFCGLHTLLVEVIPGLPLDTCECAAVVWPYVCHARRPLKYRPLKYS